MTKTDVVLIGAGIMSATLGTLLRLVEPDWSITIIERLDGAAAESSDPWNNAGTGHSALCELNYTPELPDGSIDITKAVHVNEQFQVSRQFWAHAVDTGVLTDARSFINPVPHVSFVQGFGGFPVSGQFLRTASPALTADHHAKVYGFPPLGAPPMSAPHLDTRIINGTPWLLFGPFAGWSPKFLKQGHLTDLPLSVKPNNLDLMLGVGLSQTSLVKYLIGQLRLSEADRVNALREFAPSATDSDWELSVAGQRVQVVKPAARKGGTLEFGTTVLASADGSIAGLLGASPGATTAIPAMLDVMQRCFGDRFGTAWRPRLEQMIPSLGVALSDERALFHEVWDWGTRVLGLQTSGARTVAPSA